MSCPNCGAEARGRFCTRCGARVFVGMEQHGSRPSVQVAERRDVEATFDLTAAEVERMMTRAIQVARAVYPSPGDDSHETGAPSVTRPPMLIRPAPATTHSQTERGTELTSRVQSSSTIALTRPSAPLTIVERRQPGYPVEVAFELPSTSNRLWALPIVGLLGRVIALVPHVVALLGLGGVVLALQLVLWVPVLFRGVYPGWAYSLTSGYLRWSVRAMAYFFGLADRYPPLGLRRDDGDAHPYPVRVRVDFPFKPNRWWAVPIAGFVVKSIVLIPHLLLLYALGVAVALLQLILWVPVLLTGRYPEWGYSMVGGYLRWSTRLAAYLLGLTDRYPPFQFST